MKEHDIGGDDDDRGPAGADEDDDAENPPIDVSIKMIKDNNNGSGEAAREDNATAADGELPSWLLDE